MADRAGSDPRRRAAASALIGFVFAAVVIVAYGHGDVDRMTSGDGYFYRYVALHMNATKADIAPIVAARGPALRYGRVGLPAAIWLLSAGRPGPMRYVQPLIMAMCGAAAAAAAVVLLRARGVFAALLPFVAVGFTLSIAGGYAEGLAVALLLWTAVAAVRERWVAAAGFLALAMLTRENTFLLLFGLLAWCALRRRPREFAILACSIVPVVAWHLVVAARFGHLPLADPYVAHGAMVLKTPFLSLLRGFTDFGAGATLIAAIHVALWVAAFVVWRRSILGWLAVAAGLQLAAIPLLDWQYAGDNFRLFSFFEVITVLAIAAAVSRDEVAVPG